MDSVASNNQTIEKLEYDNAGRLTRWTNADSEISWRNFDLDGNPHRTTQKRFKNASGLSASPDVLNKFVQEHRFNEHGERTHYSMPWLANQSMPTGWTKWIYETHEAMGKVDGIARVDRHRHERNAGDECELTATADVRRRERAPSPATSN